MIYKEFRKKGPAQAIAVLPPALYRGMFFSKGSENQRVAPALRSAGRVVFQVVANREGLSLVSSVSYG